MSPTRDGEMTPNEIIRRESLREALEACERLRGGRPDEGSDSVIWGLYHGHNDCVEAIRQLMARDEPGGVVK